MNGIQEVSGSIPLISTRKEKSLGTLVSKAFSSTCFCECLSSQLSWESARFASIVRHIRPDFPFPVFLSDLLDFPLKIEYSRNPKFATFFARKVPIWARSSAGRALRSHRRGRGFDPLRVHQIRNHLSENWGDFSFDHRNTTDGFRKFFGQRAVSSVCRPLFCWPVRYLPGINLHPSSPGSVVQERLLQSPSTYR